METQEEFNKRWDTCRLCGVTKEKLEQQRKETGIWSDNYVMNGMCGVCRTEEKDRRDYKAAQEEGHITRDNNIMCPYCGHVREDDIAELHRNNTYDCYECDKESDLEIEYTAHYTTTKKEPEVKE